MAQRPPLTLEEERQNEGRLARFVRKIKEDPIVPLGMAGWAGIVGYGLYNIKNRKQKLSLQLIHLRVQAQVFAVGCMTLAVVYNTYKVTMRRREEKLAKLSDVQE